MLEIRKRGDSFHVDLSRGEMHLVRGTLGTKNREVALRLIGKLERALAEGRSSELWTVLKSALPNGTFERFAKFAGVQNDQHPTWAGLRTLFATFAQQRLTLGKLAQSTIDRYEQTFQHFDGYLERRKINFLKEITIPVVEEFKMDRIEAIKKVKQSRGGTSVVLDAAILHRIFWLAVKRKLLIENPVQLEGRPGENPHRGAQPFTPEGLAELRKHAGDDFFQVLFLRWTGLRGSDAVAVTFQAIDLRRKELDWITGKRKKRVIVPLHYELVSAVLMERERRSAKPTDRVLLNPQTKKPLTRPRLYARVRALGERAGVPDVHPHRFRDTFAVDLLLRGAGVYDVAKMLGDTVEMVEKHYAPFVPELRNRVRKLMETGTGMEELVEADAEQPDGDGKSSLTN